MRAQRGMTLIELLVTTALGMVVCLIGLAYSVPWMAGETMRGAANDVTAFLQLAKIEAVSRNRDCRFVVDPAAGALEVYDGMGTVTDSDDALLHTRAVAESVDFARPDSGDAVTLDEIGSTNRYQTVFSGDGVVTLGAGEVHLLGGERFGRVAVHVAGGTEISYWSGSQWRAGS